MTTSELIDLAKRKNAARKELVIKRRRAYPDTGSDQTKKVHMDADSAVEQEIYDNLCDEYAIRMVEVQVRRPSYWGPKDMAQELAQNAV